MSEYKDLTIYEKLNAIMDEVGKIEKTGRNTTQNYAFIEQAVVMAKLRPLFVKYGIVLLPQVKGTHYHETPSGKMLVAQLDMNFTLVNADNPAERLEFDWSSEGADNGDKAINKAETAGEKYWLLKLLMISEKDDPDSDSPGESRSRRRQESRATQNSSDTRKALATEIIQRIGRTPNLQGWQDLAREHGVEAPTTKDDVTVEFLTSIRDAVVSGVR